MRPYLHLRIKRKTETVSDFGPALWFSWRILDVRCCNRKTIPYHTTRMAIKIAAPHSISMSHVFASLRLFRTRKLNHNNNDTTTPLYATRYPCPALSAVRSRIVLTRLLIVTIMYNKSHVAVYKHAHTHTQSDTNTPATNGGVTIVIFGPYVFRSKKCVREVIAALRLDLDGPRRDDDCIVI